MSILISRPAFTDIVGRSLVKHLVPNSHHLYKHPLIYATLLAKILSTIATRKGDFMYRCSLNPLVFTRIMYHRYKKRRFYVAMNNVHMRHDSKPEYQIFCRIEFCRHFPIRYYECKDFGRIPSLIAVGTSLS